MLLSVLPFVSCLQVKHLTASRTTVRTTTIQRELFEPSIMHLVAQSLDRVPDQHCGKDVYQSCLVFIFYH